MRFSSLHNAGVLLTFNATKTWAWIECLSCRPSQPASEPACVWARFSLGWVRYHCGTINRLTDTKSAMASLVLVPIAVACLLMRDLCLNHCRFGSSKQIEIPLSKNGHGGSGQQVGSRPLPKVWIDRAIRSSYRPGKPVSPLGYLSRLPVAGVVLTLPCPFVGSSTSIVAHFSPAQSAAQSAAQTLHRDEGA